MEIKELNLLEILKNTQALYATEFSGDFEAPVDLLESLLENSGTKQFVFLGFMFFQKINDEKILVVDGLKRIISLSLLLYAICECYKLTNDKNEHAIELIKKRYLFNENFAKIQLNGYEKVIYEKLVKHEIMNLQEKEHNMFKVLHGFWAKIKMNNISATQLFKQIKHIKILACINEEANVDNRDIYQYLNCNNQNIEELQLITNYIEEYAGDDAKLWYEILDMFKSADMVRKFRYFIIDFLTIQKNGIIPKENEIYMSFKRYYLRMVNSGATPKILFDSMKNSAEYYIKISTADFDNADIKQRINTIKDNNMYETFPYLLEVTEDYSNGRITPATFCELLDTVILFVAEQRSGNYESMINFANLSHEINKRIR